jgi:hypothetical protein
VEQVGCQGKKKARETPESAGRDALELMIDDFRLMIVVESAQIGAICGQSISCVSL